MNALTMMAGMSDAAIAHWIVGKLGQALAPSAKKGPVAIAVPGGSTPFPILAELAKAPLDWRRITVWPGDDRDVPEDHPASNVGRIRALLGPTGANVVALKESMIPQHFLLTWLGMGEDGHIASLFPGADPRADAPRAVIRVVPDPLPPEAPFARLSLTIPALLACEEVMFVLRGDAKRALFQAAARGENDLPVARLLAAAKAPVTCFT